ncbi:MAG: site-specific DNA-methyltransferase [Chitinophagaceae bacterium]|nr:site-specific DNA-methyltransferase [Chitinophagaceae bacterium]
MEYLRTLPDNFADLALVDPPYGIGAAKQIDLGNSNKKVKHKTKDWDNAIPTAEYFTELFRVSKNQIIWGGNYFIEHLKNTRCFIVWNKENGTNNMADCELAWASFETSVRMYNGHIFKGIGNSNYVTIHPTQKPIKLYEWIYANYLPQGGKVIDTHLGSGSNRIAADKAGNIDFYATEIDADYFNAQEKRWREYKAQAVITFPDRIDPVQSALF